VLHNNPKYRQQWILDLLKVEVITFGECFIKYFDKFSKSEVTFSKDWNKATQVHKEYQEKVNKAKDRVSIQKEIKALEGGLKSKFERQLMLQKMLDPEYVHCEIKMTPGGRLVPFERKLEPKELIAIHSELSKMEGDYAPAKVANTNVKGEDIEIKMIIK
jgi:hypothetical protein